MRRYLISMKLYSFENEKKSMTVNQKYNKIEFCGNRARWRPDYEDPSTIVRRTGHTENLWPMAPWRFAESVRKKWNSLAIEDILRTWIEKFRGDAERGQDGNRGVLSSVFATLESNPWKNRRQIESLVYKNVMSLPYLYNSATRASPCRAFSSFFAHGLHLSVFLGRYMSPSPF